MTLKTTTKSAAGKAVKRAAKAEAVPATKARKKAEAATTRLLKDEHVRRENAIARIRSAAEAAGFQKSRMSIFIGRLQARLDRSAERVERLVQQERGRQARLLEKHPELKQLNGKPSLDAAAKIPDVQIPESELPAYITSISTVGAE